MRGVVAAFERVASAIAAVALAIAAVGLALLPLTTAPVVQAIAARTSRSTEAGIEPRAMQQVVERVRAFVVDGRGTLPARTLGRDAFDERATSHLVDVRTVLAAARRATVALLVAPLGWVLALIAAGRRAAAGSALRFAGVAAIAAPLVIGLLGLLSFDALFTSFHALLFAEGSWVFPADSLLIRAFPEPFWRTAAALWGLGTVAVGALLVWGGSALSARDRASRGAARHGNGSATGRDKRRR